MRLRLRHDRLGRHDRGDRLPAGRHRLAEQQDVGLQIPQVARPDRPAAPQAGLHLVADQQPSVLVAQALEAVPERRGGSEDPRLARHRLDQHAGDLLGIDLVAQQPLLDELDVQRLVVGAGAAVERGAEAVRVGREDEAGDVLGVGGRVARHVGRVRGRQVGRFAVVLAQERQDHRPAGGLAGELDRALDGLGARDGRSDAGDPGRGERDEPLGELQHGLALDVVRDLHAVAVPRVVHRRAHRRRLGAVGRGPPRRDVVGERVAVASSSRQPSLRPTTSGIPSLSRSGPCSTLSSRANSSRERGPGSSVLTDGRTVRSSIGPSSRTTPARVHRLVVAAHRGAPIAMLARCA